MKIAPELGVDLPRRVRLSLWAILILGMVALAAERLWLGRDLPLWIDEVWTAMISGQSTWSGFWREAWLDCNPPIYYLLMKLWSGIAGQSNWALRAPSLLFSYSAALLPLFWRPDTLGRGASLAWAALILFWWPGVSASLDARGYALLLVISVAQAISFARLLERPALPRAALWVGLCSLAILTHYFAAFVCLIQGLIYVGMHRKRAAATWPAVLLLLPVAIWGVRHLPRLADYARPNVAWYVPMNPEFALGSASYLIGPPSPGYLLLVLATLVAGLGLGRLARSGLAAGPLPTSAALSWTALSGVIAFALVIGVTLMRPVLTERYLTPMVPLALLGAVLLACRSRAAPIVLLVLVALFAATPLAPSAMKSQLKGRAFYSWETASSFVAQAQPERLIFVWDHPVSQIVDRRSVEQLGGFFFRRDGRQIETVTTTLRAGDDPNTILLAMANRQRDAVIWIYNRARRSAARDHPPTLQAAAGWRCTDERSGTLGVVACARSAEFQR